MTNPRSNILCLVHRVPYPPNRGDRIRSFHLLEFLAERAEVSLAFLCETTPPQETMQTLEGMCRRVTAVRLGPQTRWLRAAWSLGSGRTATEGLFRSGELRRTIHRWHENTQFDAILVFCSSMTQYLDQPELAGVPTVVDLVDVDSQKWFDYARHSRGLKRRLFQLEGERLRRLEVSLPDRAQAVTLVSPHEADLFRSFCPTDRAHAICNGVNLDYFRPDAIPGAPSSDNCVFVGALDYNANLDGVTWLCREIWPAVRNRHPQAVFRLVGSNPGPVARRLGKLPGVQLVGQVPDVRPYLSQAALAVAPLRVARGIQNKVLEAMAMGKPVVATHQALEGIAVTPDVHVCRAATPREWVRSISELLTDPDRCARLGRAARAFVEEQFQWKTQLALLAGLPGLSECLQEADPEPSETIAVKT